MMITHLDVIRTITAVSVVLVITIAMRMASFFEQIGRYTNTIIMIDSLQSMTLIDAQFVAIRHVLHQTLSVDQKFYNILRINSRTLYNDN